MFYPNFLSVCYIAILFFNQQIYTAEHMKRQKKTDGKRKSRLILLSFSAVSYVTVKQMKHMTKLTKSGLLSRLGTGYPTTTVATQFSIATGLYPIHHGVYFDPYLDFDTNRWLTPLEKEFFTKYDVEPMWVFNQIKGGETACLNWRGAEFTYKKIRCTHVIPYKEDAEIGQLIGMASSYLFSDDESVNFILLYYDKARQLGEAFGPTSLEFLHEIRRIDSTIMYFYNMLDAHGLFNNTNLFVLGDHGLRKIKYDDTFNYTNYKNLSEAEITKRSFQIQTPIARFRRDPNAGRKYLDDAITTLIGSFHRINLDNLPLHWHSGRKVWGDDLLIAKPKAFFYDMNIKINKYREKYGWQEISTGQSFGVSGYDNAFFDMKGMFWCYGPSFKSYLNINEVEVIDIKEYVSHALGYREPPIPFITSHKDKEVKSSSTVLFAEILCYLLIVRTK